MDPKTSASRSPGAPRPKVMIVDDDESVRDACGATLSRLGCDVELFPGGDAARARLESASFDLVLTDIYMPGSINGAQLVAEIKRRSPSTDVIMARASRAAPATI
ncbi:MAG: response regulator [Elusimicrobia bacterium]|nr:response regulator [Elusimicrobiota bacterium]